MNKLHWYLAHVLCSVECKGGPVIKCESGRPFSSETQNINRSMLDDLKQRAKKRLFDAYGKDIEVLSVSVLSLSYLGFMTEEEFELEAQQ